jgi:hypothetical protein
MLLDQMNLGTTLGGSDFFSTVGVINGISVIVLPT